MGKATDGVPAPAGLAELIPLARGGDSVAVSTLLDHYAPLLRTYLERRSGGGIRRFADLEDVAQEARTSLVQGLGHLREGADLDDFKRLLLLHASWALGKVGRRASAFAGESSAGAKVTPDRAATGPTTGTVTRRDRNAWLVSRIESLGEGSAAVLSGFLAGKSFAEIADALEITEEAARKRFLRASAKLGDTTPEEGSP